MENLMLQNITTIQPLYLFTTGGTGVDKSFLTKILLSVLNKNIFLQKFLFG